MIAHLVEQLHADAMPPTKFADGEGFALTIANERRPQLRGVVQFNIGVGLPGLCRLDYRCRSRLLARDRFRHLTRR